MGPAVMSRMSVPTMRLVCDEAGILLSRLRFSTRTGQVNDVHLGLVVCLTSGLSFFTTLLWEQQEGKEGTGGRGLELPE